MTAPGAERALAFDGALLRKLAVLGARHGPTAWVRYSPPLIGLVFAALLPEQRRAIRRNLRRVLGERNAVAENMDVLRTFASYASCLAEALAAGRPEAENARRRVVGAIHLEQALARGRGLVIVTAHVGAWDAASRLLASDKDVGVMVAMRREAQADARAIHDHVRQRAGVLVAHVGHSPTDGLRLLSHVRGGGIVAVQLDRAPPGQRVLEVDLFGTRANVPEGPFRLAALAGAPVVPLFTRRVGFFDYELVASSPFDIDRRASAAELGAAAQRAAAQMERAIRSAPTQWFAFDPGEGE